MANTSIFAAFERMWHHVTLALSGKADKNYVNEQIGSLNLGAVATEGVVPISKGGTGGTTQLDAVKNLLWVPDSNVPSVTSYPTQCGIYRTVGTNIFVDSNGNSVLPYELSHYGVLLIIGASTYIMHIYVDTYGNAVFGRNDCSNVVTCPTSWTSNTMLGANMEGQQYGSALPAAGHKGRIFYKKV